MGILSDDDLVRMRARARHRLFGAVALVVLMVVGVPLLFDHHEALPPLASEDGPADRSPDNARPPQPSTVSAPGSGAADRATPAGPASPPATVAPAEHAPPAGALASAGTVGSGAAAAPEHPVQPDGKPAESAHAEPLTETIPPLAMTPPARRGTAAAAAGTAAGKAPPPPAPEAAHRANAAKDAAVRESAAHEAAPHGWFVQFGMFAEAPRAQALSERLESQGIHVHDEAVQGPRGRFTLVRAGPYGNRAAADEVLARARALGENAFLGHQ